MKLMCPECGGEIKNPQIDTMGINQLVNARCEGCNYVVRFFFRGPIEGKITVCSKCNIPILIAPKKRMNYPAMCGSGDCRSAR